MPYQPAILGTARLKNFRLAYLPADLARLRGALVGIWIGGERITADSALRIRRGSLTIRDVLNDAPNTASFICDGEAPVEGQTLRIAVDSTTPVLLFTGTLQTVTTTYEGRPEHVAWSCTAIDDTANLNRRRPFGTWENISATVIAQALAAEFAPGFTTHGVELGLPQVSITFDGSDDFIRALTRLASMIGGYTYVFDNDVHLFLEETGNAPDPIAVGYPFLDNPPIQAATDLSQLQTRIFGKGHGEAVLSDVLAGATILPVADVAMFNTGGGKAIAGTTPDGAQSQRLTYTSLDQGEVGSLLGPGVTPSAAPTVAAASGAGIDAGNHHYAYSWVTAAGETLPGPPATVFLGSIAAPTTAPVFLAVHPTTSQPAGGSGSQYAIGDTVEWALLYSLVDNDPAFGTALGPVSAPWTATVGPAGAPFVSVPNVRMWAAADPSVKGIGLYERTNGGAWGLKTMKPSTPGAYVESGFLIGRGPAPPAPNPTTGRTTLSGIALGPSGTTARKVYRTAAGAVQFKLQQTIANNTATTGATDATPDVSLGANAPTGDTSGLTTTAGQVNPGATSILTSSAGVFNAAGGWALLAGDQAVRYTGIAGNTLTGIPASGPGAVLTAAVYGSPIVAAPALRGVSGLALPMQKGALVHIWVQRDDLAAQAEQAAVDASNALVPADGIYEGPIVVDERRGEPSLIALCDATLALFARPIVTITYDTRDLKTKSGKPVTVDLTTPPIHDELTIQSADISELGLAPGLKPRFHVTASTVRASLDDLLRRLLAAQGAT